MHDVVKELNVIRRLLNDELKTILELKDFNGDGLVVVLKRRATEAGILIMKIVKKVDEEYIRKTKEAAQILYELGFKS